MVAMRFARLTAAALLATIIAVLTSGPAWAHNSLTKAVPGKNSTVKEAPERIELTFLQKVDPKALTIKITDAQKQAVALGTPKANGKVGTVGFAEPLNSGVYTVSYRVVSVDGHPVEGSYKFTLDGPVATTPPTTPPTTAPTTPPAVSTAPTVVAVPASSSASDDGPGLWPIAAGIGGLVVIVVAVIFALRRRRAG